MKVAILSDTHDNIKNLAKVVSWLNAQNITTALHCGDICFQEIIDHVFEKFNGEMIFVRGNGDYELPDLPEELTLELGGKKIFINHYPDVAKKKAETGTFDVVCYGHTHRPWVEKIGDCLLVNPGELAGQRYKPTFAIYDTESNALELKILEKL